MKSIRGYSKYIFDSSTSKVYKINEVGVHKEVTKYVRCKGDTKYVKLQKDDGKWNSISITQVIKLSEPVFVCGVGNGVGFVPIPNYCGYFINELGVVVSTSKYDSGCVLSIQYPESGKKYPRVSVGGRSVDVHYLMAHTFIMRDYINKGFCVLHLDNNKNNFELSNLKVGTYSENNKQAYSDGINKGNGLKKN